MSKEEEKPLWASGPAAYYEDWGGGWYRIATSVFLKCSEQDAIRLRKQLYADLIDTLSLEEDTDD